MPESVIGYTGIRKHRIEAGADTVVLVLPADGLERQRLTVEDDSVIGDRGRTDAADGRAYVVRQCASVAGEVEIARRPVDRFAPKCEEHRAFEDKTFTIGRFAEAVEEPLRCVSLQQELETFSGTSAPLQQPCAYGRAHVSE